MGTMSPFEKMVGSDSEFVTVSDRDAMQTVCVWCEIGGHYHRTAATWRTQRVRCNTTYMSWFSQSDQHSTDIFRVFDIGPFTSPSPPFVWVTHSHTHTPHTLTHSSDTRAQSDKGLWYTSSMYGIVPSDKRERQYNMATILWLQIMVLHWRVWDMAAVSMFVCVCCVNQVAHVCYGLNSLPHPPSIPLSLTHSLTLSLSLSLSLSNTHTHTHTQWWCEHPVIYEVETAVAKPRPSLREGGQNPNSESRHQGKLKLSTTELSLFAPQGLR